MADHPIDRDKLRAAVRKLGDRPLTAKEMGELREISSRARISGRQGHPVFRVRG